MSLSLSRLSSVATEASDVASVMPRTSEVLWDGRASLPFVLKRKRNGAILVTKIKAHTRRPNDQHLELRLGSELKLVGGFPVQQLTLGEVKKVMLHAPKPVSLLFLNHDDVELDNMSFQSVDRGSFENEFAYDDALAASRVREMDDMPPLRESCEWSDDLSTSWADTYPFVASAHTHPLASSYSFRSETGTSSEYSSLFDSQISSSSSSTMATSDASYGRRRRRSPESKGSSFASSQPPRKVSRLKLALERMNELLNRPVRRSGLNLAAGKSIVV
jgi:hypothetical protein